MRKLIIAVAVLLAAGCSSPEEKARTLYNQALTLQREGKPEEARKTLEQVAKDYPQTEIATQANSLLLVADKSSESMADNEEAAIAYVRTINTACVTLLAVKGHYPSNLADLVSEKLIDPDLLAGRAGYKFELQGRDSGQDYIATATPLIPNVSGRRYFFSDAVAVVRYEVGKPAGPKSPSVN